MHYQKIHDQIISRAQLEKRNKNQGTYYERHHIIPKCIGGNDDVCNLVLLTAREHFLIHWLLHRIHPTNHKLAFAFSRSAQINNKDREFTPSSRAYEEARTALSIASKENNTGYSPSVSTRLKISQSNKGKIPSIETRKKISEARLERKILPWNKGLKMPKQMYKDRHGMKGMNHTQESKNKMSVFRLGKKPGNIRRIVQIDLNFKIIKYFESISIAQKEAKAPSCHVVAKSNLTKKSGKHYWKFESDLTIEEKNIGYARKN